MRTTIELLAELLRQAKAKAALHMNMKDLIRRYAEQGLRRDGMPGAVPPRRRRSEIPLARTATGQAVSALTNAEIQRILDEEEAAGSRHD
jgi:hypothetical protein